MYKNHFEKKLKHLYISPLDACNLACKMCYTKKTSRMLTEDQIFNFIKRYRKTRQLESITFCGGEVFRLHYFPSLVNKINEMGIFVQIITNGTINRIKELNYPNQINLIVSLDGLSVYHDTNRGQGNFTKSISFLQDAHQRGFHAHIFSIVTADNYNDIEKFERLMKKTLGYEIGITYHPRKPQSYLLLHPKDKILGETDGFGFLDSRKLETLQEKKDVFPPGNFGCYQISLMADGNVYGCCEGTEPIGKLNDQIEDIIKILKCNIKGECAYPKFKCGILP